MYNDETLDDLCVRRPDRDDDHDLARSPVGDGNAATSILVHKAA